MICITKEFCPSRPFSVWRSPSIAFFSSLISISFWRLVAESFVFKRRRRPRWSKRGLWRTWASAGRWRNIFVVLAQFCEDNEQKNRNNQHSKHEDRKKCYCSRSQSPSANHLDWFVIGYEDVKNRIEVTLNEIKSNQMNSTHILIQLNYTSNISILRVCLV